jgi:hypothetical protein
VVKEVAAMVSEEEGDVLNDLVFDFDLFTTDGRGLPVIRYVDCRPTNAVE